VGVFYVFKEFYMPSRSLEEGDGESAPCVRTPAVRPARKLPTLENGGRRGQTGIFCAAGLERLVVQLVVNFFMPA
jgi:hypothetical protein